MYWPIISWRWIRKRGSKNGIVSKKANGESLLLWGTFGGPFSSFLLAGFAGCGFGLWVGYYCFLPHCLLGGEKLLSPTAMKRDSIGTAIWWFIFCFLFCLACSIWLWADFLYLRISSRLFRFSLPKKMVMNLCFLYPWSLVWWLALHFIGPFTGSVVGCLLACWGIIIRLWVLSYAICCQSSFCCPFGCPYHWSDLRCLRQCIWPFIRSWLAG